MLATASRRQGLSAAARWATHSSLPMSFSRGAVSALQDAALMTMNGSSSDSHHQYQQPYPLVGGVRFFAAAPSPSDPADDDNNKNEGIISRTFQQVLTPQNQFYALVAGGTLGAYAISRVFLAFTGFFTHLTPTVVAKWGFYTGFGCATSTYSSVLFVPIDYSQSRSVWFLYLCHVFVQEKISHQGLHLQI